MRYLGSAILFTTALMMGSCGAEPGPSCTDRMKNGTETGIDCGGGCGACDDGQGCAAASDCKSGSCKGSLCAAPVCTDAVKNGTETDVDCGGDGCPACASMKSCQAARDCLSGSCSGGLCLDPTCTDNVKNAGEVDVDCGGMMCGRCQDGKSCQGPSDCLSSVCTGALCQAPSCTDTVMNGTEVDADCGGSCALCAIGKKCNAPTDCASGNCSMGTCAQAPLQTFTQVTTVGMGPPASLGMIPGMPNRRIHILRIGICGDADATSGPQGFKATDNAAMTFTWAAGQNANGAPTYRLSATPDVGGSGRGWQYMDVDHTAAVGAAVAVNFEFQFDFDGRFCNAQDELGTAYADPASTTRAWIRYRYE